MHLRVEDIDRGTYQEELKKEYRIVTKMEGVPCPKCDCGKLNYVRKAKAVRLIIVFDNGEELDITRKDGKSAQYEDLCNMIEVAKSCRSER